MTTVKRLLLFCTIVMLILAGCAPVDTPSADDAPTPAADTMAAPGGMADVCPNPVVIQTDWFPEAEHGAVYNLIGAD